MVSLYIRSDCLSVYSAVFRLIKEYGLIDIRKQIATDKIKLSKTQL